MADQIPCMEYKAVLKDKIRAQDFGVPEKYAEIAEDYARYVEARALYERKCAAINHGSSVFWICLCVAFLWVGVEIGQQYQKNGEPTEPDISGSSASARSSSMPATVASPTPSTPTVGPSKAQSEGAVFYCWK